MDRVYKQQGRPVFPPGCPPTYVELATELWASDYHQRPAFKDVIARLQQMLGAFQSSMAAQAAAAAAAQAAGAQSQPLPLQQPLQQQLQQAAALMPRHEEQQQALA